MVKAMDSYLTVLHSNMQQDKDIYKKSIIHVLIAYTVDGGEPCVYYIASRPKHTTYNQTDINVYIAADACLPWQVFNDCKLSMCPSQMTLLPVAIPS
jgi:hypothetical protein